MLMRDLGRAVDVGLRRVRLVAEAVPGRLGMGGHHDYQRFVIVGSQRTGTNYLLHLLRSSGQVAGFAELFSPWGPFWAGRYYAPLFLSRAKALRDRDPAAFLDRLVFRRYPGRVRAVGFKAHYGQLEAFPPALRTLQSTPDLVVLHIRRHNLLAVEASRARAHRTGDYIRPVADDRVDRTTVRLDPSEILARFDTYEARADWPREHLPDATTFDLDYEAIADDPRGTLDPATRALGITGAHLEARTTKQNPLGWRAVVANVEEVEDAVSTSRWAYLLDLPG